MYFCSSIVSAIFKGTYEYDIRGKSQLIKHQIKHNDREQKIVN